MTYLGSVPCFLIFEQWNMTMEYDRFFKETQTITNKTAKSARAKVLQNKSHDPIYFQGHDAMNHLKDA